MRAYTLFVLVAAASLATAPASPVHDATRRGVELLHDGRLAEGEALLDATAKAHPTDRTALFYAGVGKWWRHVAEFGNERAAVAAIDLFSRAAASDPASTDAQALFEAGTSHMLMSHMEAARGSVFRAGRCAKKGKELLELSRTRDAANKDVGFALGAYDYYADQLPRLMKGIRAILMLPGGNARRGIAELSQASRDGAVFGPEASLVLADIYASDLEDKYQLGIDVMDRLVARHPRNPFFRAGRAEILSAVGEHDRALQDVEAALALVADDDAALRYSVQFQEARIRDAGWDSARGAAVLEPLVAATAGKIEAKQHARMRYALAEMWERLGDPRALPTYRELQAAGRSDARLAKKLKKKMEKGISPASVGYRKSQPAIALWRDGKHAEAEQALAALLLEKPGDPIVTFFHAEAAFANGGRRELKPSYDAAWSRAGVEHPWVAGWALVRLGDIESLEGQREAALRRYKQALAVAKWQRHGIVAYRLAQVASLPHAAAAVPAPAAAPASTPQSR